MSISQYYLKCQNKVELKFKNIKYYNFEGKIADIKIEILFIIYKQKYIQSIHSLIPEF